MKQGNTGLTVRKLQLSHKPIVELTTKQLSLWVEELPIANLGESSQMIYRLLVDANTSVLEPRLRLSILNTVQPTAQKLVDTLERQFINNHIALNDKQRKIAALVQAIQTEISIGYHAVIESIISEGVKRSNKKHLAYAICFAIKYHGLIILRCYQLYSSVPARVWREVYQLYQMARTHQIDTIETPVIDDQNVNSAKSHLTRILLLSMSNPYQLRQSEIQLVWNLLPNYIKDCQIEAHSFTQHPFYIDLNSSSPPIQKSLYKERTDEEKLKISVVAVADKLKIDLAQVSEKARYSARRTMIYRHLIHCWSQETQRSFARTRCDDNIDVSIGLGATHYLLNEVTIQKQAMQNDDDLVNSQSPPQTLEAMEGSLKNATLSMVIAAKDRENTNADRNYLSTSAITDKDVWAKLYNPHQTVHAEENQTSTTERSRDSIVRDSYKIQTCDLINMSPGGYCIQVASEALPKHAQTGEVIGFIESGSIDQHWSIGVVRWVRRQVKGTHIQMGVQLLAPDVIPISIQLRNSRSEENAFQRALLLPALTGVGQAATIITNPLAFNVNNKLRVREINHDYDVRLTKEINASGSSKQFNFEKISNTNNLKNQPPSNQTPDPDDLDNVWDLI